MKKGMLDTVYLIVGIFVVFLGIITVIGLKNVINPAILTAVNESGIPNVNITQLNNTLITVDSAYSVVDIGFIILILGAFLSVLIGLWYVRSNPLLLIVGIIILFVLVFVTIIMRDVFLDVINANSFYSGSVGEVSISDNFVDNLPTVVLIILGIFLVVMYAKGRGLIE